jgi:hypothetical protein
MKPDGPPVRHRGLHLALARQDRKITSITMQPDPESLPGRHRLHIARQDSSGQFLGDPLSRGVHPRLTRQLRFDRSGEIAEASTSPCRSRPFPAPSRRHRSSPTPKEMKEYHQDPGANEQEPNRRKPDFDIVGKFRHGPDQPAHVVNAFGTRPRNSTAMPSASTRQTTAATCSRGRSGVMNRRSTAVPGWN